MKFKATIEEITTHQIEIDLEEDYNVPEDLIERLEWYANFKESIYDDTLNFLNENSEEEECKIYKEIKIIEAKLVK